MPGESRAGAFTAAAPRVASRRPQLRAVRGGGGARSGELPAPCHSPLSASSHPLAALRISLTAHHSPLTAREGCRRAAPAWGSGAGSREQGSGAPSPGGSARLRQDGGTPPAEVIYLARPAAASELGAEGELSVRRCCCWFPSWAGERGGPRRSRGTSPCCYHLDTRYPQEDTHWR